MTIDKEFLEILCCPETRKSLQVLDPERMETVNRQIAAQSVKYKDGKVVDAPLQEALITDDDTTIYRVDDEIPVMKVEMGIATDQLDQF